MCSSSVNVDVSMTLELPSEFALVEDNADTGALDSKPSTTPILSFDGTLNALFVVAESIRFGVIKESVRAVDDRIINTHRPLCSDKMIILGVRLITR